MGRGHLASHQNRRRKWLKIVCSAGMILLVATSVRAQGVTFTQITTGGIVTTPAAYWGGSWGDYDDDGWLDLFVGSTYAYTTNYLYRNNHDGTFTLIDAAAMPKEPSNQHGAAWADYDNDGHLDLLVTMGDSGMTHNMLYNNNGNGTFSHTFNAIYDDVGAPLYGFHAPRWGDYNNDGLIDLFIAGHNARNRLFRNDGGGAFTKITNHVLVNDFADSEGSAWVDYDDDGDLDLFVSNFSLFPNALYRNDQNGVFTKTTSSGLTAGIENTVAACWADYDNDGFLDLFLANQVTNSLYHNNGDGTFFKVLGSAVTSDSLPSDWFFANCAWADYDNDGAIDLYISAGNASSLIPPAEPWPPNAFLYHNSGDGTFTKVTDSPIADDLNDTAFPSWVDYDNDGFIDFFGGKGAFFPATNLLFHNNGNANAWLNVKLVGTVSNRSAIGAKVRVNASFGGSSHWQLREISGGDGQNNQQSLNAEFGLADATTIDTLRVEWPSGIVQEFQDVAPRQFLTITEPPCGGSDSDGDGVPDDCDNCPTVANTSQADGGAGLEIPLDGVGDACDNCTRVNNPRVHPGLAVSAQAYVAANPWATLSGGQRDDDHDGYGNKCDGDFTATGVTIGPDDLTQYRSASGKARSSQTACGSPTGQRCARFDLSESGTTIGPDDLTVYRALNGKTKGPRCATHCTGLATGPLACLAGSAASCSTP